MDKMSGWSAQSRHFFSSLRFTPEAVICVAAAVLMMELATLPGGPKIL